MSKKKIAGHTNTLTPSVLEIIKINIFFRPGRSHVRNWQKLVLSLKILVLLKRIFDLQKKTCNFCTFPVTNYFPSITHIYLLPGGMLLPWLNLGSSPLERWWRHLHHLRQGGRYLRHLWQRHHHQLFITAKARSHQLTHS